MTSSAAPYATATSSSSSSSYPPPMPPDSSSATSTITSATGKRKLKQMKKVFQSSKKKSSNDLASVGVSGSGSGSGQQWEAAESMDALPTLSSARHSEKSSSKISSFLFGGSSRQGSVRNNHNHHHHHHHNLHGDSVDLSFSRQSQQFVKIFSERVRQGCEFKGVVVKSNTTTCAEVLHKVLEMLQIQSSQWMHYGLYDVLGHIEPPPSTSGSGNKKSSDSSSQHAKALARSMGDLHRLSDSNKTAGGGGSTAYSFVEFCCRRINVSDPLLPLCSYWQPKGDLARRLEVRELSAEEWITAAPQSSADITTVDQGCQTTGGVVESPSADRPSASAMPMGPFLLLLRGQRANEDTLLCELGGITVIGSTDDADVRIFYPQEGTNHVAVIQRDCDPIHGDAPYYMILQTQMPDICINHRPVTSATALKSGDIINLNGRYVYLFKDPAQMQDRLLKIPLLDGATSASSDAYLHHSVSNASSSLTTGGRQRNSHLHHPITNHTAALFPGNGVSDVVFLSDVIGEVLDLFVREHIDWRSACCFVVLLLEYAAVHLGETVMMEVRGMTWERVQEIVKKCGDHDDDGLHFAPIMRLAVVLFEIHLYYCQEVDKADVLAYSQEYKHENSEYFKKRTEDTMQFIFNGLIDKSRVILYSRSLIDDNPFDKVDRSHQDNNVEQLFLLLNRVVNTFRCVSSASSTHLTNQAMFILFATIAKCLVNAVMSEDELLSWESGVGMRANLDRLQEWFIQQNLKEIDSSTQLLSAIFDLLATPKRKLTTMSWFEIRNLFAVVPPSVLHQILQHYDRGYGVHSRLWKPEMETDPLLKYSASKAVEDFYQDVIQTCSNQFVDYDRPCVDVQMQVKDRAFDAAARRINALFKGRAYRQEVVDILQASLVTLNSSSTNAYAAAALGGSIRDDDSSEHSTASSAAVSSTVAPRYRKQQPTGGKVQPVHRFNPPSFRSGGAASTSAASTSDILQPPVRNKLPFKSANPSKHVEELLRLSRSIQDLQSRNLLKPSGSLGALDQTGLPPPSPQPRASHRLGGKKPAASVINAPTAPSAAASSSSKLSFRSTQLPHNTSASVAAASAALSRRNESQRSAAGGTHSFSKASFTSSQSPGNNNSITSKPNSIHLDLDDLDDSAFHLPDDLKDLDSSGEEEPPAFATGFIAADSVENLLKSPSIMDTTIVHPRSHYNNNYPSDQHNHHPLHHLQRGKNSSHHNNNNNNNDDDDNDQEGQEEDEAEEEDSHVLEEEIVFVVLRKINGSLGLGLVDGTSTQLNRPGLFIRTVKSDGAAGRSGLLDYGDEVTEVDGQSISGLSYSQAMELIKRSGEIVRLRARKADAAARLLIMRS